MGYGYEYVSDVAEAGGAAGAVDVQHLFSTVTYVLAGVCFILSLKWLSSPVSARRGNIVGESGWRRRSSGRCAAQRDQLRVDRGGLVIGSLIGAPLAIWMPMTAVPQRTRFRTRAGVGAALVGTAHYQIAVRRGPGLTARPWAFCAWKCCWGR